METSGPTAEDTGHWLLYLASQGIPRDRSLIKGWEEKMGHTVSGGAPPAVVGAETGEGGEQREPLAASFSRLVLHTPVPTHRQGKCWQASALVS